MQRKTKGANPHHIKIQKLLVKMLESHLSVVSDKTASPCIKDVIGDETEDREATDVDFSSLIEVSGVDVLLNDSKLERENESSSQSILRAACITLMMSLLVMILMGVIIILLLHLMNRKQE